MCHFGIFKDLGFLQIACSSGQVIRVKDVESDDNAPSAVNHLSFYVPRHDQTQSIKDIIDFYKPKSTIVFVSTR